MKGTYPSQQHHGNKSSRSRYLDAPPEKVPTLTGLDEPFVIERERDLERVNVGPQWNCDHTREGLRTTV
jgi:hypothetical protein